MSRRVLDVRQGSQEWLDARLGIPTASQFSRIITPKTGKLSSSSRGYLCELVAERYLGVPLDDFSSDWTHRGTVMEERAVAYYELRQNVDTAEVGFVVLDLPGGGRVGCSPDRLVGDDGGLEIKCPGAAAHIAALLEDPSKHAPQVQGSIWVTGRRWWDFLSFCPGLPPLLRRYERDEEYGNALEVAVSAFAREVDRAERVLRDLAA